MIWQSTLALTHESLFNLSFDALKKVSPSSDTSRNWKGAVVRCIPHVVWIRGYIPKIHFCLLYTSDAADE